MKILQVTNFFKPSWESGGPARVVYEVSKQLVQRGHEVTVYTTDGFKSRVNVEKNKPVDVDGITTYYFRNLSLTAASMNLPIPYHMPSVIRKEIDKFDIIHIHEHRTILAAIVTYYAKKYNIPFVLQPRGSAQKNGKIFLKTIFDLIFGYKILKNAKKVILSSNNEYYISKDILKNGGVEKKNIEYIPNGIDVYSYQNITSRSNFLESYDIKISEKVILYLGRIHKVKGLDLLVESFKDIITERKDVSLFIIGPDNGYKDKLRSIISRNSLHKKVLFLDGLYNQEKLSAYVAADVFVLPSKKIESFGNVALEAIACGIPTVVTNICGISEWIDNIIKVDPNPRALKEGILRALDDGREIGKMAQIESKNFDWNIISNKIEVVYQEIVSS